MKLKLLFLALFMSFGVLQAQNIVRSLIITEAKLGHAATAYAELTNMGDTALPLNQFEFGEIGPWTDHYFADLNHSFMLPDKMLQPGESFVIAMVFDWGPKMYNKYPYSGRYNQKITKDEMWDLADVRVHAKEAPYADPTDSITPYYPTMDVYGGRSCWYIEQHFPNGDSVVIDQVNGNFENAEGNGRNHDGAYDVAGVTDATNNCVLIRKFTVTQGDTIFSDDVGTDISDSKWIPIPILFDNWEPNRRAFWTVGNHQNTVLDQTTLTSSTLTINWTDTILTVPWGVRNEDSLMMQFNYQPGLAWHYDLAKTSEDSAFTSVREGDILTVYACGNTLQTMKFHVQTSAPGAGENRVIPKAAKASNGYYGRDVGPLFDVTDKVPGMDTIRNVPFSERVDTLFKYLEKADKATWEIVWSDGMERVDLVTGDILRVTAENGSTKDYYIKLRPYIPNHSAWLGAITWPDVPDWAKGTFWDSDTIPGFNRNLYDYSISLPPGENAEPALIAKAEQLNTKINVERLTNFNGPAADRVVSFTSTAEDDTTVLVYNVQISKQKEMENIQPFSPDPFISEFIFWEQWANGFLEICNPGTRPLDLSNYMIFGQWATDPKEAITWFAEPTGATWLNRYVKYIPGYKWQDSTSWKIQPAIAVEDNNVNPIVQPGDVFVLGDIRVTGNSGYPWFASEACDIDFSHNPWGPSADAPEPVGETAPHQWMGADMYLYKILNDSIKLGLKPATDPNDFELIETWGNTDGGPWVVGGVESDMINSWIRKPQYWQGKTGHNESFGTNAEDSEWLLRNQAYYDARNAGWPNDILFVASDLGKHFMNEITIYKSTVTSNPYKVSEGFSMSEEVRGVVTGTTADDFLAGITKADTGQTLTIRSSNDGSVLSGSTAVTDGDSLIVLSADSVNTSAYLLSVTDQGLSDDAALTSATYSVSIDGASGEVGGFPIGTSLRDVVNGVNVPAFASMIIIDDEGRYVSMKRANYDTLYVDVPANNKTYLLVTAEDGVTQIQYRLQPNVMSSDAYVTSFVYDVNQQASVIQYVPRGTTVDVLFKNVIPATDASMQIVDKMGHERMMGGIYRDDKLVVTAQDGVTKHIYFFFVLGDEGYLAYVLSDVYMVDQDNYDIAGQGVNPISINTTVSTFMSHLTPAPGATIQLVDKDGAAYSTGNMKADSRIKVTSENLETEIFYNISVGTAVDVYGNKAITLYPNPTTGIFNIAGLETGNRVQVYNLSGTRLRDVIVSHTTQEVSLEGQPGGMYFVVVSNDKDVVGRYKLILK